MPTNPLDSPDLNRAKGVFPEPVIQAARQHPDLDRAMRRSVHGALSFIDTDENLRRHMSDVGRFFLGLLALYLDASGGLTHRRLRELSGRTGLISAGRATAMLWQLQRIGYIVPVTDHINGRRRDYVLTPAMAEAFRDRLKIDYGAMAIVNPDVAPVIERFDDPRVQNALYQFIGGDMIAAATQQREDTKPISEMATRNAGILILYSIIADADDHVGTFPPAGRPVPVSISRLAARYFVSRSHVARVLREAEGYGLILRNEAEGLVAVTPHFADILRTFYAVIYAGFASTARNAQKLLDAAPSDLAEAAE